MTEEVADVAQAVLDHRRALEREAPGDHAHVLGQAHGAQHLGAEHTRVADLRPLVQVRVEREDLHARLRVRVVRRLEAHLGDADLLEERLDHANEVTQGQVVVGHDALDLVELGQVGRVHALVAEDAVDREVLLRRETARLVRQLVEHLRRDGRRVRAQDVGHRRLALEGPAAVTGERESTDSHTKSVSCRSADIVR